MEWASEQGGEPSVRALRGRGVGPFVRTGYLMTGNARDAEDLVQETLLRVARRWNQVRSMDHPAAYARRILINLVLQDAAAGSGSGRSWRRRWPASC